jgi:hypothetical protein
MDRLPHILSTVLGAEVGLILLLLLQGKSAHEILFTGLLAFVASMIVSAGVLRWRGLPLNATVGEYNERVRFLRNEVTRVSTDDDAASG